MYHKQTFSTVESQKYIYISLLTPHQKFDASSSLNPLIYATEDIYYSSAWHYVKIYKYFLDP